MSIEDFRKIQFNTRKKSEHIIRIGLIVVPIIIIITILSFIVIGNYRETLDPIFVIVYCIFFMFGVMSPVIFFFVWKDLTAKSRNLCRENFKELFVIDSLKKVFNDLEYDFSRGFDEDRIKESKLINTGREFFSNDYIKGIYRNIQFEQADVVIRDKSYDSAFLETIFKGRWIIFDFNKSFRSIVHVYSKGFNTGKPWRDKKLIKINLENEEFNNNFMVFAENEHDASYVLTPRFMERIEAIFNKLKCDLYFGFVDNKLHIAVNNYKDAFEYGLYDEVDESKIQNKVLEDIKIITDFVDELDLDNKW